MRILAISGSLRGASSNTQALRALTSLAPAGVEVVLYEGIGELPHFNPDMDGDAPPGAVVHFRAALAGADGVVFSSPEYAHGVPGVLKNALDWVVGSGEFAEKPVAIVNASPRAVHALASLTETLTMMAARIVPEASIAVPLLGRALPEGGILADAEIADALGKAIADFARTIGRG
ncbi:FMN reductase [Parvibaculum sedimenti]|uniref:FMN reductase n=1 Tax=Parvibaculum sedimenti TaxID=2608632 RepID=A0A6N6VNY1_9HYPH|nr:NADPH-dependent FMN reductase [Parvibaculum sedimenti]KAB7742922.1 FMN reductase [Parvibaculum sedimenti]